MRHGAASDAQMWYPYGMARTTLDLDSSVLRQLRRRSRQARKSMGQLASELLARGLAQGEDLDPSKRFEWRTWNLGMPRVDLEDKEAMRMALEEPR